jgi:high-affinity iron transporter
MLDSTSPKPGRRLLVPIGAALLSCLIAFLALTALGVDGGGSSAVGANVRRTPPHIPSALQAYSEADSKRNGAASQGGAPPITQLVPIPPAAFKAPIAHYKAYSAGQLRAMLGYIAALQSALRANRLAAARAAWRGAYVRWLELGAVYGAFGALSDAIDGTPGGLPGGVHDPHFTGLHRLERGLWRGVPRGASVHELLGVAVRLENDVRLLIEHLPSVQITPLEYATRAHEILEDAQRDLLSGTDVPWSHEGLLATAAGLSATREVLATLAPLLDGREGTIETVEFALRRFSGALSSIRRAHGERFPAQDELSLREGELLDGTLGAALEALDAVPGTLETKIPPPVPALPSSPGSSGSAQ